MRRLLGGLVVGCVGLSLGWALPAAEAADSCSLTGTYAVDGLGEAAGFLEAVGTLTFTPNPGCTDGTVGGAITIRHQGQPPAPFTPAGTYCVSSAGAVTLTLPGVIDLVGVISLEGGGGTTANSLHLAAAFMASQVFSVTGTRMPPLAGLQDLTCPPDSLKSGPSCLDTYEASVWEITPGNAATIAKIKSGTVTLAELTAAGVAKFKELAKARGRDPNTLQVIARAPLRVVAGGTMPEARPLLVGTPEQIVEDIGTYKEAGVTGFMFDTFYGNPAVNDQDLKGIVATLEAFVQKVRPRL